jgi:hypothetical protein
MDYEISLFKNWIIILASLIISDIENIKEFFQILVLAASFVFTIVQIILAIKKYKKDK